MTILMQDNDPSFKSRATDLFTSLYVPRHLGILATVLSTSRSYLARLESLSLLFFLFNRQDA